MWVFTVVGFPAKDSPHTFRISSFLLTVPPRLATRQAKIEHSVTVRLISFFPTTAWQRSRLMVRFPSPTHSPRAFTACNYSPKRPLGASE